MDGGPSIEVHPTIFEFGAAFLAVLTIASVMLTVEFGFIITIIKRPFQNQNLLVRGVYSSPLQYTGSADIIKEKTVVSVPNAYRTGDVTFVVIP